MQAFRAWTKHWNEHDYTAMRSTLNPAQDHLASAKKFASCYQSTLVDDGYDSVTYQDTVRTRRTTTTVAGAKLRVTEITADLAFSGHEPITRRMTLSWYADGSTWRWIADHEVKRGLRLGQC